MLPERIDNDLMLSQSSIRDFDKNRGEKFLINAGYGTDSQIMKEYQRIVEATYMGKATDKMRSEFVARVMLTMYDVVKISEVGIYYIGQPGIQLYNRCRSEEVLSGYVSLVYQILFGFKANIQDATKYLKAGITLNNTMQCIDRRYIWVVGNYCWDKVTSELYEAEELPSNARVFAKMFDTESEDEEVFKVPEFDENQVSIMKATFP